MNINRQTATAQLMIDIKHQPDRVLVDVCAVKKLSKLVPFLEFTYPEMQRKRVSRVYGYQSSTSSHTVDD